MNRMKARVPRIEPCGTPIVTGAGGAGRGAGLVGELYRRCEELDRR